MNRLARTHISFHLLNCTLVFIFVRTTVRLPRDLSVPHRLRNAHLQSHRLDHQGHRLTPIVRQCSPKRRAIYLFTNCYWHVQ
jgi:hypothetical protein